MLEMTGRLRSGLLVMTLLLCAVMTRGDEAVIKDGNRLVDSEFAHNWADDEDSEERVLASLCQRSDVDVDMSLTEFVKWLEEKHSLAAELDQEGFAEAKIAADVHVRVKGHNLRLETVLNRALKSLESNVTWRIESGTLLISLKYDERKESRAYSVKRLIDGGFEETKLIELLVDETSGPWQVRDEEGGTITILPRGRILVRQTQRVHFEIARLIRRLQELD